MTATLRHLALALTLLGAAAPTLSGCKPYAVVQQSGPPSALQGVTQIQVRFDWSQVRVLGKTEADYLAEKNAEEQADFQVIKQETDQAILQSLQENVGAGVTFTPGAGPLDPAQPSLVVGYADVQTGIYTPVYSTPSPGRARCRGSRAGTATDIIDPAASGGASLSTPSDHQRMGMVGKALGRSAARFFVDSQGAAK